jgi:hypothetical protein
MMLPAIALNAQQSIRPRKVPHSNLTLFIEDPELTLRNRYPCRDSADDSQFQHVAGGGEIEAWIF